MKRIYILYFDAPRADWERQRKRLLLATIIAIHLALIAFALRQSPPLLNKATSLVVVLLNAGSASPHAGAGKTSGLTADAQTHPAPRKHEVMRVVSSPAQTTIRDPYGSADGAAPASTNNDSYSGSGAERLRTPPAVFIPPRVLHRARMVYPRAAVAAEAQGQVDVLVTVGADGALRDARIDHASGNADLDATSLDLIHQYIFKAAEKGGVAVEAEAIVTLEWRIGPRERFELSQFHRKPENINLDARMKAIDFLQSMPPHRLACDHMKNPDCLETPSADN